MMTRPLVHTMPVYPLAPIDRSAFNVGQPAITLPPSRGMRDPLTGDVMHVMVPATRAQTP